MQHKKLSICIPTFNRAELLEKTLESIIPQIDDECEVVICDNASTDATEEVALRLSSKCGFLRYIKNKDNIGLDRNFDLAVSLSCGEYCWLFPDDDILMPEAVSTVLGALQKAFSMVLVNHERRNFSMSQVLLECFVESSEDRIYPSDNLERLFNELIGLVSYAGSIIIQRSVWMRRHRSRYYDTMWIHIGVTFEEPLPGDTLFIATPIISYREGNTSSFWPDLFEILAIKFPALLRSLPISDASLRSIGIAPQSLQIPPHLAWHRAMGFYSFSEYKRFFYSRGYPSVGVIGAALIAVFPGRLMNALVCVYWHLTRDRRKQLRLCWLERSRFYWRKQPAVCRFIGARS